MDHGAEKNFFISYTRTDEAWARWIAVELERTGYTTVVQAFDFLPGSDFAHEMQKATTSAARTIAVLSPAYSGSRFAESEWRVAFAKDPTGEHGMLLPVRVQPCEPPGLLATRVFVDLVGVDEPEARKRLLGAVGPGGPRPSAARFPGRPYGNGVSQNANARSLEHKVLTLRAAGRSDNQIVAELNISHRILQILDIPESPANTDRPPRVRRSRLD